jgi:TetR/AcrR family transcriptional repressor of nem operon
MARPREFNEDAALDAAMHCFWNKGYQATSVRDLEAETGLTTPSLYNAFGDKRALFRRSLERYAEHSARVRIARLEAKMPPKEAIRAFITEIVEHSLNDKERRGCLIVNSALEIAPHDPEIGAEIATRLAEVEAFFRRCIVAAQKDRSVPPDRSPKDVARLLLGVTIGIRVVARTNPDRQLLEGMARPALALLNKPKRGIGSEP